MKQQPIEQAHDADMRLSVAAMNRAACRAREVAVQTGTRLVFSRGGIVQTLEPSRLQPNVAIDQYLNQTHGDSAQTRV